MAVSVQTTMAEKAQLKRDTIAICFVVPGFPGSDANAISPGRVQPYYVKNIIDYVRLLGISRFTLHYEQVIGALSNH